MMRRRLTKFVYLSRLPFLLAVLVVTAMASLPEDSRAACPRIWEYDYYFDAART